MTFEIQHIFALSYLLYFFLGSAAATIGTSEESNSIYGWIQARAAPYPFPADANGICHTYTVQAHETCKIIAKNNGITVKDLEKYNKNTYDWKTCAHIAQGRFICLGPGAPPMPVSLPNVVCGPQVPGTARPNDMSNLRALNPCPSHQCCSSGHCDDISTGICKTNNGCLSNCVGDSNRRTDKDTKAKTTTTKKKKTTTTTKAKKTTTTTTKAKKTTTTTTKAKKTTTTTTTKKKPKTTTTTTEAPMKTPWSISIYSGKKCDAENGDYIDLNGYTTGFSECVDLSSNFNTDMVEDKTSCRLFVDGGFNWTSCEDSDMLKPKSWYLHKGSCMVYSDHGCGSYSGSIIVYKLGGCQDSTSYAFAPDKFGSIKCSMAGQ